MSEQIKPFVFHSIHDLNALVSARLGIRQSYSEASELRVGDASFYEVGDPITIKGEPMTFTVVGKKGNCLMIKPKGQISLKLQAYL